MLLMSELLDLLQVSKNKIAHTVCHTTEFAELKKETNKIYLK